MITICLPRPANGSLMHWLLLSILLYLLTAPTAQATDTEGGKAAIKRLMNDASSNLSTLIPLAYNDEAFQAGQNQERISLAMARLENLFSQKALQLGDKSDTAWISLQVLQQHLSETSQLYSSGYYAMSQYLLTSTPAICATCHLQDSAHGSIQSQLARKDFANDYSYAEYLFTVRQYDEAERYYKAHLQDAQVQNSRLRYLRPMERLMTIELGIRQSPDSTTQLLEQHQKATGEMDIKQILGEWLQGLESIKPTAVSSHKETAALFSKWLSRTPNTGHEFILDESTRPQAIWLRAKLYELLPEEKSRADSASALHMLAVLDRLLGQDEPYSFANLYLKQCVMRYPETESARLCLEEYKNHLSFYYGGSAGEAVPEELVREYQTMRKVILGAQ